MIYPQQHPLYTPLWAAYFRWIIARNFHGFYVENSLPKRNAGLLVLANHFSWWDGFFVHHLNRLHFKRQFHVMMLEENLQKNKFLRYSGAYSVNRSGRSLVETLQFTNQLLESPRNMVLIFPQGTIKSAFQQSFLVEKGAYRVVAQNPTLQVATVAIFVDYFEKKKPGVYVYVEEMSDPAKGDFMLFKQKYVDFQERMRAEHGERSQAYSS